MRGVNRYLVQWKRFIAENDSQEKKKNLGHVKELVDEFEGRLGVEIRRQEGVEQRQRMKLNPRADEFKRMELSVKYTAKLLYRQNNKKFEEEYLRKLKRNWNRWKNNRKKCEEEYARKIDERKYMRNLEESLEQDEIDEKMSRMIWRE